MSTDVLEKPTGQQSGGDETRPCIHLRDRGEHDYRLYGVDSEREECSYCGHPREEE